MEREPVEFLVRKLAPLLDESRAAVGRTDRRPAADLVFVHNATGGVNSVLRSLKFEPGDEILVSSHDYNACRNVARYVARRSAAAVVEAPLPLPIASPGPGDRGRAALRDGPHAAGLARSHHQPDGARSFRSRSWSASSTAGASTRWSTGPTRRAWFRWTWSGSARPITPATATSGFAPEGGGLPLRPPRPAGGHPADDDQPRLQPAARGLHALCRTPSIGRARSIRRPGFASARRSASSTSLLHGGLPALMRRNHELAVLGRASALRTAGAPSDRPGSHARFDGGVPVARRLVGSAGAEDRSTATAGCTTSCCFGTASRCRSSIGPPRRTAIVRISAQAYNHPAQYQRLAEALQQTERMDGHS